MLPKIRTGYICLKCCCGNDGFDFAQSLCRLKKAATSSGLKLLEHAVNMEKILLNLLSVILEFVVGNYTCICLLSVILRLLLSVFDGISC